MKINYFVRNIEAENFFDGFLISAVASILLIRSYLFVTGFPQIGTGDFHVAHMLVGGFFMLISIYLLITYMGKLIYYIAAILGGIGFGTFIDELGKFITRDNNYFYQPTVALIYAIFILIYLLSRFSFKISKYSSQEYLINSIEILKEAVLLNFDTDEKRHFKEYLGKSNPNDPIVDALKELINKIDTIPASPPNIFDKIYISLKKLYLGLIQKRWFSKFIIWFFILNTFFTLFSTLKLFDVLSNFAISNEFIKINPPSYSFWDYGELISSIISGVFVLVGVARMKFSRLTAFISFKRSMLVSIYLTQFFVFYEQQFLALLGLLGNVTVLLALDFMINREKKIQEPKD